MPLDFNRKNIPNDAGAGLTMAMVAVPDAIASAILAGVSEHVLEQIRKTETTESIPEDDIFMATDTLGGATVAALAAAKKWLEE
jgi:hypothetical protein